MARTLVENLADTWDPSQYTDEYRENLMKIIKAKLKGKEPKLTRARRAAAGRGRRPDGAAAAVAAGSRRRREGAEESAKTHASRSKTAGASKRRRRSIRSLVPPWKDDPAAVRPMLASTGDAPLESAALAYEPKYDGIRALVSVDRRRACSFWSRLGNEKTAQFPEMAAALRGVGRGARRGPSLLDGEIVALDERGDPDRLPEPAGAHSPEGRRAQRRSRSRSSSSTCCATATRTCGRCRCASGGRASSAAARRRARSAAAHQRAGRPATAARCTSAREALGWEGLIAKRLDSVYKSGRRSPDWRKLKLVRRQACVVAGWTEPARFAPVLRRAAARRLR